jgi:PelA/Pel-15E family pectate lyase
MKLRHPRICLSLCAPLLGVLLVAAAPAEAKVIAMSQAPQGLTAARIAALPAKDRAMWQAYFDRSQTQRAADKAALAAELKPGQSAPPPPPESFHDHSLPLDKDAAWYGTAEARHTADVIVSFQTPAGGWGKNQDFTKDVRLPGQPYVAGNISAYLAKDDFDTPREPNWNYVGTLDNNATTTQLHFLALVAKQAPGHDGDAYRASFVRGIRYLLAAQFPNGGWPQVWPLEGGYHDAITYNDDAVTLSTELLTDIAENEAGEFGFVPADLRAQSAAAAEHALDCILATQVVVKGKRTVWGQQHDALSLKPEAARNYEPAVLASDESANLLAYLMSLPNPSPELVGAIHSGAQWLKAAAINGYAWAGRNTPDGNKLVAKAGAGPLWARYYIAETMQPVFGDRDKTIHDDVNELSLERRNGYSWYNTGPMKTLKLYETWSKAHPQP